MEADVLQNRLFRFFVIRKADVVKGHTPVRHHKQRIFRVLHRTLFFNDFRNSPRTCRGHGNHDKDHGKHHQIQQDIHTVGKQAHEIPGG